MAFRSGSTRYLVRESPDEVVEGIRELLHEHDLAVVEKPTRRGCRMWLEDKPTSEGTTMPAFEIGELELRFSARDEHVEVEVRSRRRRRYWALALLASVGVVSVVVDVIVSMGLLVTELNKAAARTKQHHESEDPRLIEAAAKYLGPRDLGSLEGAQTPFRQLRG